MRGTHSTQSSFVQQSRTTTVYTPLRSVRQDKRAKTTARFPSPQPAPQTKHTRAVTLNTNLDRSQKPLNPRQRTEKITTWLNPLVKAEIERLAKQDGLSVSATSAALLEEAIRQKLHIQHAVLLQPMIQEAIYTSLRAFSKRHTFLLTRSCFASEQTRSIVANILGRQPDITPDLLNSILDNSAKTAKRNLTRKTPQLETLLTEIEQFFMEEVDAS